MEAQAAFCRLRGKFKGGFYHRLKIEIYNYGKMLPLNCSSFLLKLRRRHDKRKERKKTAGWDFLFLKMAKRFGWGALGELVEVGWLRCVGWGALVGVRWLGSVGRGALGVVVG